MFKKIPIRISLNKHERAKLHVKKLLYTLRRNKFYHLKEFFAFFCFHKFTIIESIRRKGLGARGQGPRGERGLEWSQNT